MSLRELQEQLLDALTRPGVKFEVAHPAGLELTRLLVLKLRFERLIRASPSFRDAFRADPEAVTGEFTRYAESEPFISYFPIEELARFQAWKTAS